jgi:hypothetical protein
MKRNPLWDAHAQQFLASGAGAAGAMMPATIPNALANQAAPGVVRQGRAGLQQVMDQRRQAALAQDERSIRNAYMDATGREADPEGLAAHMQNPGGARPLFKTSSNHQKASLPSAESAGTTAAGSARATASDAHAWAG